MFIPRVKLYDERRNKKSFLLPLDKITLVGGLINSVGSMRLIDSVAKAATKINPEVRALSLNETSDRQFWLASKYKTQKFIENEELFLSFLHLEDWIKRVEIEKNLLKAYRVNIPGEFAGEWIEDKKGTFLGQSRALTRLALMAASLIDAQAVLVDEIEQGLHHSSYKGLWMNLFESSSLFDAQIVATTNSLEIIETFALAAQSFNSGNHFVSAKYIEIARSEKNEELIAIKHDPEEVIYRIERDKPLRG